MMTLVAVSMNQVIHGRTRSPSASASSGAWTWSVSQAQLRQDSGRLPREPGRGVLSPASWEGSIYFQAEVFIQSEISM
ncbi:hypothetical protein BFF78_00010 [Streptomyces fodineus]|uniref:Uncharacterized protein n=1 Tax=Streptomyces fodineus TaxID=1904616 RepID=A0A1D7Y292_9ACTN|nr:hypothetical protein BFF78_00010 [Streptomyces fodineus]